MAASMARSMELKRMFNNTKKKENQTMEQYMREIQKITDALATINSPVSLKDIIEQTLLGLGPDYESIITTLTSIPEGLTFDKLRRWLVEQEQHILYLCSQEASSPAAFVAQPAASASPGHDPRGGNQYNQGRGQRGQRGRGTRGRGRGYGQQHQPKYVAPGYGQQTGYYQPRPGQQPHGGYFQPQAYHPPAPPHGRPGSPLVDGQFGSIPSPVVCHICYSPGHSATSCPSRFSQSSAPALAAPMDDTNDVV
ncbi:unnamed protein product [Cuscuta epithymum]|uniref:CCHC-type domain-containing protein n=1 Tax=Cuscuta epithymum TaxID=186058 RepID=A0AAV0GCQ5_9ASTE|nr:unnamed protein product [Cuscuta epithymum]